MSVIVTTSWDDGCKTDLKILKLLKKYNLKGTFYIPIKEPHKNLNKKEIRKLSKEAEIGSHGVTHRKLTSLSNKEIKKEIFRSKKILEKITGKEIKSFSYPYGLYNKKMMEYVKKAGYTYARTTKEFCFKKPSNKFRANISLQLSKRISRIFSLKGIKYILKGYSWDKIAKALFDKISQDGIFHIFGHSWEIEKNKEWNKLKELFKYITNKRNIICLTNNELYKLE